MAKHRHRLTVLATIALLGILVAPTQAGAGSGDTSRDDGLFINEFLASNATVLADEFGEYDDWIEIANLGTEAVALTGWGLSDDLGDPLKWTFPDTTIQAGEFLIIWADDNPVQGPLHTTFKLSASGEQIGLFLPDTTPVDTLTYGPQTTDISMGRYPDGADNWIFFTSPTPGETNLPTAAWEQMYINEFLATNLTILMDEFGEYDDWIEILNLGDEPVVLTSWGLTDDLDDPMQWVFPDTTIQPGEHLIVWADNDPEQGPLHATFKLSDDGEDLGLFLPDTTQVNAITFGEQADDISMGRLPDGGSYWVFFEEPTPGGPNVINDPPVEDLYINEFLASNETVLMDEFGEYDDWIEIVNLSEDPISLAGWGLTDDLEDPLQWTFPDTSIAPGAHMIVWADNDPGQGPLHATFKLGSSGEQIGLFQPGLTPVDTLVYGQQTTDISMGRLPDGGADWFYFQEPTPGAPNVMNEPPIEDLFINEFLASNQTILMDEFGEYDDWIEIVNLGEDPISLAGWWLTDDLAIPLQWMFPDTTIQAGEYLLVWADNDPEQGPLHATFKLGAGGEQIGLYQPGTTLVDSLTYAAQTTDISMGRLPDGADHWVFFNVPTPGAPNGDPSAVPEGISRAVVRLDPSPFAGEQLRLRWTRAEAGRVSARVYDLEGRQVASLGKDLPIEGGELELHWDGRDNHGRAVPGGIYLIRLADATTSRVLRVLRVR